MINRKEVTVFLQRNYGFKLVEPRPGLLDLIKTIKTAFKFQIHFNF